MWLWIVLSILLVTFVAMTIYLVAMTIYQRKKEIPYWNRIPELRKQILTAKTKEELIKISEELRNMVKGSNNEYLQTTVNTLILVIKDKIELEFKE